MGGGGGLCAAQCAQLCDLLLGHTFGIRVEADIRRDLFTHMQDLGFDFYDRNRTGQLMSRLTSDLFDLTELAHHGPEDTVTSCITIVGALVVMFTIQWRLALVVAVLIPIFALVVTTQRKRMAAVSKEVKQKAGHINTEIETLPLRASGRPRPSPIECWENDRFSRANGKYKTSKRQFHKAMARFSSTMEFFLCILQVAVIAFGGFLIMRNQMDLVDLLTVSLYIGTFVSPMRKSWPISQRCSPAASPACPASGILWQQSPARRMRRTPGSCGRCRGALTWTTSPSPTTGTWRCFNAGPSCAARGDGGHSWRPSGGGKSTLCQLIPRFYDVSSGSIRIGGVDVRQVKQRSIHQNIGIVQQDVFLFADTIFQNIRYGKLGRRRGRGVRGGPEGGNL